MTPAETAQALAGLLQREAALAEQMLETLERERRALKDQDFEALEGAAEAKLERHRDWEKLDRERRSLLCAAGFAPDRDGLAACIASCDSRGRLTQAWETVSRLLEDCRRLNRANGLAVDLCRRQVDDILAALRGGPATAGAPLYDANGGTHTEDRGHSLGSA